MIQITTLNEETLGEMVFHIYVQQEKR